MITKLRRAIQSLLELASETLPTASTIPLEDRVLFVYTAEDVREAIRSRRIAAGQDPNITIPTKRCLQILQDAAELVEDPPTLEKLGSRLSVMEAVHIILTSDNTGVDRSRQTF